MNKSTSVVSMPNSNLRMTTNKVVWQKLHFGKSHKRWKRTNWAVTQSATLTSVSCWPCRRSYDAIFPVLINRLIKTIKLSSASTARVGESARPPMSWVTWSCSAVRVTRLESLLVQRRDCFVLWRRARRVADVNVQSKVRLSRADQFCEIWLEPDPIYNLAPTERRPRPASGSHVARPVARFPTETSHL